MRGERHDRGVRGAARQGAHEVADLPFLFGIFVAFGICLLLWLGTRHDSTVLATGNIVDYRLWEEPWHGRDIHTRVMSVRYKVRTAGMPKELEVWVDGSEYGRPEEVERAARQKVGTECTFHWSEKWQSATGAC